MPTHNGIYPVCADSFNYHKLFEKKRFINKSKNNILTAN